MNTGIFFDIDGTLRDVHTANIPASTVEALKRLRKSGYKLGVATGRAMNEIYDEIKELMDWDAYVCLNGQAVYTKDAGKLQELCFSGGVTASCLKIAERTDKPLQLISLDGGIYLTREPNEDEVAVYQILGNPVPEVKPYQGETITGIMLFGDDESEFKEYSEIQGVTYVRGMGKYADIVMTGVSKHTGILLAMEHYGLADYIAFGDSFNDVEMLQNAKISVAMGESDQRVIETAGYHTAKVTDDGIEKACIALGLFL